MSFAHSLTMTYFSSLLRPIFLMEMLLTWFTQKNMTPKERILRIIMKTSWEKFYQIRFIENREILNFTPRLLAWFWVYFTPFHNSSSIHSTPLPRFTMRIAIFKCESDGYHYRENWNNFQFFYTGWCKSRYKKIRTILILIIIVKSYDTSITVRIDILS